MVSLGPGDPRYLAPESLAALESAEVVVGYRTYLALVAPEVLAGKTIVSTGMRGEVERCEAAVEAARSGKATVLVSSGDAGVYGMAGLVLEVLEDRAPTGEVEVEIVPGIPAVCAAAALLGAPLMHDFAVISLSDLLTPWESILRRVRAAAEADFVIALYNPRSRKRDWQLEAVREVISCVRSRCTPVGIVRNAMRDGQTVEVTDLARLDPARTDMLSILLVGNSSTRIIGGRMVTPRGYFDKYRRRPAKIIDGNGSPLPA